MQKKVIIGVVVLLVIVIGVIWFLSSHKNNQTTAPLLSVSAFNQTKNQSATSTPAQAGDTIVFTLNAENQSDKVIEGYILQANLSGITDKATFLDASGAQYDSAINSLVWTPLDIPAHGSITKTFSVRTNQLPVGQTSSIMKFSFNNEISIMISPARVAGNSTTVPGTSMGFHSPSTGAS